MHKTPAQEQGMNVLLLLLCLWYYCTCQIPPAPHTETHSHTRNYLYLRWTFHKLQQTPQSMQSFYAKAQMKTESDTQSYTGKAEIHLWWGDCNPAQVCRWERDAYKGIPRTQGSSWKYVNTPGVWGVWVISTSSSLRQQLRVNCDSESNLHICLGMKCIEMLATELWHA